MTAVEFRCETSNTFSQPQFSRLNFLRIVNILDRKNRPRSSHHAVWFEDLVLIDLTVLAKELVAVGTVSKCLSAARLGNG